MNLKKAIRFSFAHFLYFTGLLFVITSIRLRRKAVVLMYHRVLTDEEYSKHFSMNGIVVRAKTFERQMKFIARNFHIMSPLDFLTHMEEKIPFDTKSCLVTFDDGWKDNFKNALPILKENKVPALIFLSTGFIGTRNRFWQARLIQALYSLRDRVSQSPDQESEILSAIRTDEIKRIVQSSEAEFQEGVFSFVASCKKENVKLIEEKIAFLNKETQSQEEEALGGPEFLDWQEIDLMEHGGMSFGSHGITHQILPTLGAKEIEREACESKELIENKLGKNIWALSYPNGDWNQSVVDATQRCGYRLAFTTENGPVTVRDHLYRIKRRNIFEDMTESIPMFLARLAGLW